MVFFSKKFQSRKKTVFFPILPRKFRIFAIGINSEMQEVVAPLLRQHNAEIKYLDSAMELLHEPRMADALLVYPIEMGINRRLATRLKHVRIQLRYESEGTNDALHVLQLAIQVSTNPGSYQELKNRVDRFDAKWNDKLEGIESENMVQDEKEVMNSDLAAAFAKELPKEECSTSSEITAILEQPEK